MHFGCLYLERAVNLTTICLSYIIDGNKLRMLIFFSFGKLYCESNSEPNKSYTDHCNIYGNFWHYLKPPKNIGCIVWGPGISTIRCCFRTPRPNPKVNAALLGRALKVFNGFQDLRFTCEYTETIGVFACFFVFVD